LRSGDAGYMFRSGIDIYGMHTFCTTNTSLHHAQRILARRSRFLFRLLLDYRYLFMSSCRGIHGRHTGRRKPPGTLVPFYSSALMLWGDLRVSASRNLWLIASRNWLPWAVMSLQEGWKHQSQPIGFEFGTHKTPSVKVC
jgi:hypothetical protein